MSKRKVTTIFIIISVALVLILIDIRNLEDKEGQEIIYEKPEILEIENISDEYYYGEDLRLDISVKNSVGEYDQVWIGCSLKDPIGNWIDIESENITISGKENLNVSMSKDIEGWLTGEYGVRVSLWDKNPSDGEDANRIDQFDLEKAFKIYTGKYTFEYWDGDTWEKRDGAIGQTRLEPDNIILEDGELSILIPKGELSGGEIRTVGEKSYGSYEICMKVADAPSSITGFFMYKSPDFYHEIDIEIFNQEDSEIWLTTYGNGRVNKEFKTLLDFDPTEDYHIYRIDYYPDKVSFYVDGDHIKSWDDGFTDNSMKLMVNSWFPIWLDGRVTESNRYTKVRWIKH